MPMTAHVVGEHIEIRQVEFIGQMRHAARVLMPAVNQNDGAARGGFGGDRPAPVEKCDVVVGGERVFGAASGV